MELSINDPEYLNIDLETMTGIMTGIDLLPWQKQTFDTVYGGFKRGEMMTFAAGRGTGKSAFTAAMLDNLCKEMAMLTPPFEVLSTADVDGAPWYTVSCRKEVSIWVRENGVENQEWYNHINEKWMIHHNIFDMSQEMLAMTKLRWGT